MKNTYTVMLRAEPEGGFTVLVPALQGCVTYGETIDEALRMAEDAIRCYVHGLQDLGEPVPQEGSKIVLPVEELTGTLLIYRVSAAQEVVQVA